MIAGAIMPPGCYLSAVDILRRQYTAHLLTVRHAANSARHTVNCSQAPRLSSALFGTTGWCQDLARAGSLRGEARPASREMTTAGLTGAQEGPVRHARCVVVNPVAAESG
ncbi:hypothetical protein [Streptomyces sp. NPDC004976]